ncbi:MAG: peptide ABC transporter substrate-binding protein [Firmicutes bacterium]|nr:peptide ABC transporter substrate-binding protein [Bacillota bacterium]
MKKILALVMCFLMIFSLAACGGGGSDDSATVDINVCFASEPQTIDPALNSAVDGAIMLQHAFEGLVKWVDDGNGNAILAPGMAESWDISEDGLVYTFHMREGAVWSDGQPVTANDFEYSWARLIAPETAADYSYMIDPVKEFKAIDEATFEVTLHVPTAYFEEICAFPATFPVRQDIIEQYGDQWTFDPATYVSNGPFVMTEWEHNSYILFAQNESYYAVDELKADTIKFHLMDDANAMLAGLRGGDLDFIQQVPTEEIPALLGTGELKVADYVGTYYVCFQTELKPFDDPRVREAFSLVIDRNYICEQVKADGSQPATGFVPAGMADYEGDFRENGGDYYSVAAEDYEANCEKARQLLADAGFPGGEGFPVVEYLYNTDDGHKAVGEALQNMWQEELGVTVTLQNQDWAVFLQERKDGNYSIARNGWIADYNDPMCFLDMWVTGSGNNDAQYSNADYDAMIAAAKAETDPAKRMEIMHDAEDLLMGTDVVHAPIYYYVQTYMEADGLDGWYYTPLGYFFFGYATK